MQETTVVKKRGRRAGTTPSEVRENKRRIAEGLEPMKPPSVRNQPSKAILPISKKAKQQEVLAQMLGRKSKSVVSKILEKALDDNDKDQMECLKIVMDRIVPKDYLTKSAGKGNSINIQIMGVESSVTVEQEEDFIEGEFDDNSSS